MKNISIIIVCGYLNDSELEKDRLIKFSKCLKAINNLKFQGFDNVIVAEYGYENRLEKFVGKNLDVTNIPYEYIFVKKEGQYYNQSLPKNAASELSKNEILLYINSDIILQPNCLDVIKNAYNDDQNYFGVCARHDVFLKNTEVDNFIIDIANSNKYKLQTIVMQDPGWYYAMKHKPINPINLHINTFLDEKYKNNIIYDFLSGYFVFGDFMVMTKEMYNNCKFDEDCFALTDVYLRDRLLNMNYPVKFLHNETTCFHLCGTDYMGQTKENDPKRDRLHQDQIFLAEKYPELRHWLVFGFHKENLDKILKYYQKQEVIDMIDNYKTELYWQYFTDKDFFCNYFNYKS